MPGRQLATGKYGCTEVRVYPAECGEQLGTDPSKFGSSKSLVLKSLPGEGTLWDSSLPVSLTLWDTPALFTPPLPLRQDRQFVSKKGRIHLSIQKALLLHYVKCLPKLLCWIQEHGILDNAPDTETLPNSSTEQLSLRLIHFYAADCMSVNVSVIV